MNCWRGTSIKTRIETSYLKSILYFSISVEEEHPLKQGLKRYKSFLFQNYLCVEEEHPLKQGLKPTMLLAIDCPSKVEEEHPLKQGLKLIVLLST